MGAFNFGGCMKALTEVAVTLTGVDYGNVVKIPSSEGILPMHRSGIGTGLWV